MLIAVITSLVGLICTWKFSAILGVPVMLGGLFLVARQYVEQNEERTPRRDYDSGQTTYNISEKRRR